MSESAYEEDSFKHGIQSTLLSSARKKSKTIKATKAVICRRKSNKTASAARVQKLELKNTRQWTSRQSLKKDEKLFHKFINLNG